MIDGNRDAIRIDRYAALLAETARAYPPMGFEVIGSDDIRDRRFCIIRHDVDMAPARALDIARIEHAQGVRATYMVLLTGTFYNPLERAVRDQLIEIAALGHDIGLHFDAAWHGIADEAQLTGALLRERDMLAGLMERDTIDIFSFHNTTAFTMGCRQPRYAGMWNAYAGVLQDNVDYVSDSNGYWRHRSWAQALADAPPRLQVLTHPEWWTDEDGVPAEKIAGIVLQRAGDTWSDYCRLLAVNNRQNRSDIDAAMGALGAQANRAHDHISLRWLTGDRTGALMLLKTAVATAHPGDPLIDELGSAAAGGIDAADPARMRALLLRGAERLRDG